MHSRLQQYPEMFLVHSRAFVAEPSHLGPNSLTPWARGMCRKDSLSSQCAAVSTRQTIITFYVIIIPTSNLIVLH